ncbi:hypothetical protein KAT36_03075 [Candidatus Pacearchaeota archaeon]|nr:hypothetical protein [Candidatus Pacearchaeota archaeon]
MEDRMKEVYKNILTAALVFTTIAFMFRPKLPEPTTLDITPKLGTQLEMLQANAHARKGIMLKVYDKQNSRQVLFYDHGFDGTLDEVAISGGGGKYTTHKPKDIVKWNSAYNGLRQKLGGNNFEPIFDHFVKKDHISYVNKLESIIED